MAERRRFPRKKKKNALPPEHAWDKIRNVVYFIGYKAEMLNWMYNGYSDICNLLYELYQCRNLNYLDLSYFNTEKVTNMSFMFNQCKNLKNLNISSFDTNNVINMSSMFSG